MPGQHWADGVACPHDRVKRDCEWCNPQPGTVPALSRPAHIAALHAAALFLVENPDLPAPTDAVMHAHDVPREQFRALAEIYGAQIIEGPAHRWLTIVITSETLHGVNIRYTAHEEH